MKTNQSVTLQEIEQIIIMTKNNVSRYQIARTLKRSTQTIYRYQKKYLG